MLTADGLDLELRSITDEEAEFFFEHGWVRLRRLISPELAGRLLARAKQLMGEDAEAHSSRPGIDVEPDNPVSKDYRSPSADDQMFRSLVRSPKMGANIARVLGRHSQIRLIDDELMVKLPADAAGTKGAPTHFHQDGHRTMTYDEGLAVLWMALDEIRPEQGPLVFYDHSYQLGPLGRFDVPQEQAEQLVPQLARCPRTEAPLLNPGDATIHHSLCVHGAPKNTGGRPRWAYRVAYLPGDARFIGLNPGYSRALGVEAYDSIDLPALDDRHPIVHDPDGGDDGHH